MFGKRYFEIKPFVRLCHRISRS